VGGYLFFSKRVIPEPERAPKAEPAKAEDVTLRVYYPYNGRLNMEERKVSTTTSKAALAEAAVAEFLKAPARPVESLVPSGARLLGVYPGNDGILYVDLSDEFRRNFQGDALSEHLLLRGLYESVVWNVYGVEGVKVLIEGGEVESVGGHMSAARPLTVGSFHMEKEEAGAE
jgi:spore germination protein GerM